MKAEAAEIERKHEVLREEIEDAASTVGMLWPVHSFVTSNPLSGLEDRSFHEAVERAEELFGANGYPDSKTLEKAWQEGRIQPEVLERKTSEHGYEHIDGTPKEKFETLLDRVEQRGDTSLDQPREWDEVDAVITKWLSVFLDQGRAEWDMPSRQKGFYDAWREVAGYDPEVPDAASSELPDYPLEAVADVVSNLSPQRRRDVFESQFASLPGWASFIRWRVKRGDGWQSEMPVTLPGYMAVRLALVDAFDAPLVPEGWEGSEATEGVPPEGVLTEAWEESYRESLVEAVSSEADKEDEEGGDPLAKMVFCIDTRSEIIRRHIEDAGPYETHGFAGFFGVPIRYEGYDDKVSVDAHPPILESRHHVENQPCGHDHSHAKEEHDRWSKLAKTAGGVLKKLKTNATTPFALVEKGGLGYGLAMATRTVAPDRLYAAARSVSGHVPDENDFCEPTVDANGDESEDGLPYGMTLEEKVRYAESAFESMGWDSFPRLVVFAGHGSHTTNNPFDSSLDCGACAANPGGPNARVFASICNDDEVRAELAQRGFGIPDDTLFVAAEHNTTTDEITIYDSDVPESHQDDIEKLRSDLAEAREGAAEERADSLGADGTEGRREVERRAADWAETQPEWGLAGNASFVVGPRRLTEDLDLDGRAFLHSYDWENDPDGDALEGILLGPMVVTQWINSQYYFASVDNSAYGSGSKVTQNPVGNVGVYQGNGGDVMSGLPSESLYASYEEPYHQPLRISVVVHAPAENVVSILKENKAVASLVENGWLNISVVDPQRGNEVVTSLLKQQTASV